MLYFMGIIMIIAGLNGFYLLKRNNELTDTKTACSFYLNAFLAGIGFMALIMQFLI